MNIETGTASQPLQLLFSYSHTDEVLLNELKKHLAMLRRLGIISTWHDRDITAGTEWENTISSKLEESDVILLIISPDFIASDYCWDVEMKRAMERHDAGEALVIPVFLRQCDWKGAIFGKIQGLPTDARPVTGPTWSSHDEAFAVVAAGIRKAIDTWLGRGYKRAGQSSPQEAIPAKITPSYTIPKLRSSGFNAYAASRDILAYLDVELAARMEAFERAGYVVDHDQRDGRSSFRVLADDQVVYFLSMWPGGLGNDKGMSFFHGWGNRSASDGSTTATATPVPDEYTAEAKLDVLNMSLLGHGMIKKTLTKDEFLNTLWGEIVKTVDQLGRRR